MFELFAPVNRRTLADPIVGDSHARSEIDSLNKCICENILNYFINKNKCITRTKFVNAHARAIR
jgi:hypothetical protein